MPIHRRSWLQWLAASPAFSSLPAHAASPAREELRFPADFGSHPSSRTEWWYVTGALQAASMTWGFQVTFFRSSTGAGDNGASAASRTQPIESSGGAATASRFRPSQLLFAHAAITDLSQRRIRHDQRIARSGFGIAEAATDDTTLVLRDWRMKRTALAADASRSRYSAQVTSDSAGFAFALDFDTTQPVLLQGDAGISRKGPGPDDVSRYYSEPQLAAHGKLSVDGKRFDVVGKAWLDHEWSDAFIPAQAVGWDWIGMNLDDGSALTAFRLRRADGSTVYAGGSHRAAGAASASRSFGSDEVKFTPGRVWQSDATRARYPVEWRIATPVGEFTVKALLDDQELDSRGSTGSIYWEGLSDLLDAQSRRIGRGYLEMTGYASTLRL